MSKKTVLIYGVSSFVGSNLAEQLRDKYRVVGTYNETKVQISNVISLQCDVYSKEQVERVMYMFKPDITIYAVGLKNLLLCQEFPKLADALNTAGVFNVSQISERYQSKFIYFSSSYIFSGENTSYTESDSPSPLNVYGNTVASAEFFIQKSCLNYIIFRCSPIFGRSYNPSDKTFVENLEYQSFLDEKMVCDNRVRTGFIDIVSLAKIVDLAIDKNTVNKLIQITGADLMTHYEFALAYFKASGRETNLATRGDWKYPINQSSVNTQSPEQELIFKMNTSNLVNELGVVLPKITEMIENYQDFLAGSGKRRKIKSSGVRFV